MINKNHRKIVILLLMVIVCSVVFSNMAFAEKEKEEKNEKGKLFEEGENKNGDNVWKFDFSDEALAEANAEKNKEEDKGILESFIDYVGSAKSKIVNFITDPEGATVNQIMQTIIRILGLVGLDIIVSIIDLFQTLFAVLNSLLEGNSFFTSEDVIAMKDVVAAIAYPLLALFFVVEFCKQSIYFENMTIERFLKPLLMLVLGKFFISNSGFVLEQITNLSNSLMKAILSIPLSGSLIEDASANTNILTIISTAYGNILLKFVTLIGTDVTLGEFLFNILMSSIFSIVLTIVAFVLVVVLLVRFIELSIMFILSPIFFAALASEATVDIFKKFIKYYFVVSFQVVLLAIYLRLMYYTSLGKFSPLRKYINADDNGLVWTITTILDPVNSETMKFIAMLLMSMVQIVILGFMTVKSKNFLSKIIG